MGKRKPNQKKIREEEQAIGAIYKQYIDTFQETSQIPTKTFVKSTTLYADSGKDEREKGQLYTPKPIIKINANHPQFMPPPILKKNTKSKSNLKSLGDELKILQYERMCKETKRIEPAPPLVIPESDNSSSTNLFVSNLNPQTTESHLIQLFGGFGPLASVKIMWPRGDDTCRNANCGFVAFMSRNDAKRALEALNSPDGMRVSWGKAIKLPQYPVHIPPELHKLFAPPPQSGLPFNAQIIGNLTDSSCGVLSDTVVKVTIPFDRSQLAVIHRMVEFVVRNGPEFEALIIMKELGNSSFNFLSDFNSPEHTYYRWKLYSILHGDPKNSWKTSPFCMFQNGSIWLPPTAPNYKNGMPQQLIEKNDTKLSEVQTNRLIFLIRHLTISRSSIAKAMTFCLNHGAAIGDVIAVLGDCFKNVSTAPMKKVARLYLLSDIIHNCNIKRIVIDKLDELCLEVFGQLHETLASLEDDKKNLQVRVLQVLRSWVLFHHFDSDFVTKLENIFLWGDEEGEGDDNSLYDKPLDGANLLKRFSLAATTPDCLIVNPSVDMFDPC